MIINKIKNFLKSLFFHIYSGFPKTNQFQIDHRFLICVDCDSYDYKNSQCLQCGCFVNNKKIFLNKLAWADQECPLGKWEKIDVTKK